MKQAYRYLSILFILFFVVDTMRADGGDVLERIVRLPKTKGTVYSLLGNVSQQSGYMFIYDSKVIDNDAVVKIKSRLNTPLESPKHRVRITDWTEAEKPSTRWPHFHSMWSSTSAISAANT